MRREAQSPFVLALSPSPRGFAFVLFEGPTTPFDWGIKDLRGGDKSSRTLAAMQRLIVEYHPKAILIEEVDRYSRRGPRIRDLLSSVEVFGKKEGVAVFRYGRRDIRKVFANDGARTRPEIAKAIADRVSALAPRLPPLRKLWMSEDPRQSLFDAAALATVFFARAARAR